MIDVKEANAATAQVREKVPIESDTFRDPAEMVTLSANRFERLIRGNERMAQELGKYEEMLGQARDFIDTVAREWAEKGLAIPSYEDMSRMAVILKWSESYEIRDIRTNQRIKKEAANNGEAAD